MENKEIKADEFYDNLSKSWDETRPAYTPKIFRKITSLFDRNKSLSVLDFGCGTGLLCRFISDNFPNVKKIDGIDISSQMIKMARLNCPECNFYAGDIFSTKLSHYDIIVSKDVFNHIENINKTILKLDNLLKSRGMLVIANRERDTSIKTDIINSIKSLNYKIFIRYYSFKPNKKEIDIFLKALSNFKEEHKKIIRKKLESRDKYYIISAIKQ